MTVKFGLVGFGLFGQHHAKAIAAQPNAELTAICAASETSRQRAAEQYPQATIYDDFRALAASDVDVVDVVVPNSLHTEVGHAVLDAGKHLFIEKPMANSITACRELLEKATAGGLICGVNHELRLSSLWGGAKELITAGRIGRPQFALVELSRFPYRQGSQGWRYDIDRVGNWILEEPIHFFDLARWYLGRLRRARIGVCPGQFTPRGTS